MENLEMFKSKENAVEICYQVLNDFISMIKSEVVVGTYIILTAENIKNQMMCDFKYTLDEFTNALKLVFETHKANHSLTNCNDTEFCVYDDLENCYYRYSLTHDTGEETVKIFCIGFSSKEDLDFYEELAEQGNHNVNFLMVEKILNQISAESFLKTKTLEK